MLDNSKSYKEIKSKYLAESLAFLGFRYYKMGYGKETIYSFEATDELNSAFSEVIELKEKYR